MKTITGLLLACLVSCASTKFYDGNGKKLAEWQGNMQTVEYKRGADGSISWKATRVNHSSATTAGGNAITKGIGAAGTALVTGAVVP